jgi:hypothetical protein
VLVRRRRIDACNLGRGRVGFVTMSGASGCFRARAVTPPFIARLAFAT